MKTPAAKRFLASRFDFVREKKAYSGNLQPSLGEKEKKEDKEREETKPRTGLGEKETKEGKVPGLSFFSLSPYSGLGLPNALPMLQ